MPVIPLGVFLGVGNALLDMCAVVDDEFLKKYDVFMNTSSLAEERHMGLFRDLIDEFMPTFLASGSAQNAVRVCQWMLMSPGATSYMGCIGRDEYGDTMKHCLSADGVNVHFMEESSLTTGTLATLVTASGERALIANLAAANSFSEDHLHTDKAVHLISASRFIYIPGFFIMDNTSSLLHVARRAAEEDKTFMFNLSAVYLVQFFMDNIMTAMPYCDFVFCNEAEALTFGEMKNWGLDIPTIALRMAGLPKTSGTRPRVVVVTQGGEPTIVASMGKVSTYPIDAMAPESLIDINGAGDAFVGGFTSKLIIGEKLGNCVRAGHWAARAIIQEQGCTFPKTCDYV